MWNLFNDVRTTVRQTVFPRAEQSGGPQSGSTDIGGRIGEWWAKIKTAASLVQGVLGDPTNNDPPLPLLLRLDSEQLAALPLDEIIRAASEAVSVIAGLSEGAHREARFLLSLSLEEQIAHTSDFLQCYQWWERLANRPLTQCQEILQQCKCPPDSDRTNAIRLLTERIHSIREKCKQDMANIASRGCLLHDERYDILGKPYQAEPSISSLTTQKQQQQQQNKLYREQDNSHSVAKESTTENSNAPHSQNNKQKVYFRQSTKMVMSARDHSAEQHEERVRAAAEEEARIRAAEEEERARAAAEEEERIRAAEEEERIRAAEEEERIRAAEEEERARAAAEEEERIRAAEEEERVRAAAEEEERVRAAAEEEERIRAAEEERARAAAEEEARIRAAEEEERARAAAEEEERVRAAAEEEERVRAAAEEEERLRAAEEEERIRAAEEEKRIRAAEEEERARAAAEEEERIRAAEEEERIRAAEEEERARAAAEEEERIRAAEEEERVMVEETKRSQERFGAKKEVIPCFLSGEVCCCLEHDESVKRVSIVRVQQDEYLTLARDFMLASARVYEATSAGVVPGASGDDGWSDEEFDVDEMQFDGVVPLKVALPSNEGAVQLEETGDEEEWGDW